MRSMIFAFAATALAVSPALASDKADVMAIVKQYNDDFTKGDTQSEVALCAPQAIIIDDFAPHVWQGASACADWHAAFDAASKGEGDTSGTVTLGKPWHVTVTGDRAYADYPTHYAYKHKGAAVTEQGVWTFALQKLAAGWRITGWAWAQH